MTKRRPTDVRQNTAFQLWNSDKNTGSPGHFQSSQGYFQTCCFPSTEGYLISHDALSTENNNNNPWLSEEINDLNREFRSKTFFSDFPNRTGWPVGWKRLGPGAHADPSCWSVFHASQDACGSGLGDSGVQLGDFLLQMPPSSPV